MSHFLVMVIGDDPETQLAPFHEFECTGQDDQYVQDIDETEGSKEDYEKLLKTRQERKEKAVVAGSAEEEEEEMTYLYYVTEYCGRTLVPFGESPDLEKKHKYGYALVDEQGNVTKVVNRTNPNAKWDWYSLGGRYSGRLAVKEGAEGKEGEPGVFDNQTGIDQARKGDIDFESMREEERQDACDAYDRFARATKGHPWPESWKNVLERYGVERIDEARAFYRNQPMVKAMNETREFTLSSPDDYGQDRDQYVKKRVESRGVPFAFIKDGQWHERGEMGWWAVVTNEMDKKTWVGEFWKMFNALPDDTLISMYDCHI